MIDAIAPRPEEAVVLLDYDGTLTPIVDDPREADLGTETVELLHRLSWQLGGLAIVSGRPGAFLAGHLDLRPGRSTRLHAFGRSGLDHIAPDGTVISDHRLDRWLPTLAAVAAGAAAMAPDAGIEPKGVVVTLQWRKTPEHGPALRAFAERVARHEGLSTRDGKMSIELFPPEAPTKGSVVSRLAAHRRFAAYFGDDTVDLAAFDALDAIDALGTPGRSLRGCVLGDGTPAELIGRADLILEAPGALIELLRLLDRALSGS